MSEQAQAVERYAAQSVEKREKRSPAELVTEGREQAKALMQIVKEAGLSRDLGGNKPHLEVEAWQTIGRFNGYLTDIAWTKPIVESGKKVGYEARAELVEINTGVHVIGAEASCFFDEEIERRDGTTYKRWTDDYAVRSMAQTRAQSKLGRMAFAWVAVLGGFSGTPAEEMEGVKRGGVKPIVFPFGKHKDATPDSLSVEQLQGEEVFWTKKVAEETNPRFKTNNERLLHAIQEAIKSKSAPPSAPSDAPPASEASTPDAPAELSGDLAYIRGAVDIGAVKGAQLSMYIHKTFGSVLEKLDAAQLKDVRAWVDKA